MGERLLGLVGLSSLGLSGVDDLFFSQAVTVFQIKDGAVFGKPVQKSRREMGILQEGVPFVKPNLRSNQRGIYAMALFENFKQQAGYFLINRVIPQLIDKQNGIVLKALYYFRLGMITLGVHEQVQEFTEIYEIAAIALVYGMNQKSCGKSSLAATRRAG